MREWLSGGVSPCQGEGRGFESRLALFIFSEVVELRLLFLRYRNYNLIFGNLHKNSPLK